MYMYVDMHVHVAEVLACTYMYVDMHVHVADR